MEQQNHFVFIILIFSPCAEAKKRSTCNNNSSSKKRNVIRNDRSHTHTGRTIEMCGIYWNVDSNLPKEVVCLGLDGPQTVSTYLCLSERVDPFSGGALHKTILHDIYPCNSGNYFGCHVPRLCSESNKTQKSACMSL